MIDIKDLRIGNLVFADDANLAISALDEKGAFPITLENDEWYIVNQIDPIQITSEWLERFGFEWDIYWQGRTDGNWVLTEGNENGSWRIAYGKRRHDIIVWGIKYIHQLQNLYFALAGKELTISTPKPTK